MPRVNSPLAVLTWQQVYKLTWFLGLDYGPYTAVILNAFVMGVTGCITVRAARDLFGDGVWRLRRVSTLFALCGMFWFFGAVLVRDCYTTFFNTLALWVMVRWLARPTHRNLFLAIIATCISAYAMRYLRAESVVLFGFYWSFALLLRLWNRWQGSTHFIAILTILTLFGISSQYFASYTGNLQTLRSDYAMRYTTLASNSSDLDSLGMRLVVNQPLPLRLVLGSGSLMISPIPLWSYLHIGVLDNQLIKCYHGFYQTVVLPFAFVGLAIALRPSRVTHNSSRSIFFLAAYFLINILAVVSTSLEIRHFAQYLPALILIAVIPDTRDQKQRLLVKHTMIGWLIVVIFVHLTWAILKLGLV